MSYYRLYFRDRDGHFYGVRQFEAGSDVQAIGKADRMARGFQRELWWRDNLLRKWDGGKNEAACLTEAASHGTPRLVAFDVRGPSPSGGPRRDGPDDSPDEPGRLVG